MSTTDDAEYARLARRAERAFPATGTGAGVGRCRDEDRERSGRSGSTRSARGTRPGPNGTPLPSPATSRRQPTKRPSSVPAHEVPAPTDEAPSSVPAHEVPAPTDEAPSSVPAHEVPAPTDEAPSSVPAHEVPAPTPEATLSPAARSWRTPGGKARRGLLLAAVAALAVVAAGSGYAALGTGGLAARHYPAARPAGAVFGADAIQPGQGIAQAMGQVASYGDTTVAVGSQAGGDIPRAQFFVSHDDGRTWGLAAVSAPGGGAPSPGHAAQLVTRGQQGWLAVGPDAIWTSATGRFWTLAAPAGITPADVGDQLSVLAPMGSGFLAAGQNPAEGTAVAWTSPDGRHWQRMTPGQLRLPAGGKTVADLTSAATRGTDILLAGDIATASGGRVAATWLSTDDGLTWTWAPVPVNHGATGALAGIAASAAGFIAIRPGNSPPGSPAVGRADGVVYVARPRNIVAVRGHAHGGRRRAARRGQP